ncbi:MAG: hypothetical protein HY238_13665 [Acidobacteria bacterium]|nr:hypothetical protein [Acidobacteriota bacterium]
MDVILVMLGLAVIALLLFFGYAIFRIFVVPALFLGLMVLPFVVGIPAGIIISVTADRLLGNLVVLASLVVGVVWVRHWRNHTCHCPLHELLEFLEKALW